MKTKYNADKDEDDATTYDEDDEDDGTTYEEDDEDDDEETDADMDQELGVRVVDLVQQRLR